MYTINEQGKDSVAGFVLGYGRKWVADNFIDWGSTREYWYGEAEKAADLAEDGYIILEMRATECRGGKPHTLTMSLNDFDKEKES